MKKTHKKRVRKNKTKKRTGGKRTGGKILGMGVQGCVVDSIDCRHYTKDSGFVAKLMKTNTNKNMRKQEQEIIQNRLAEIDPNEERYALYHIQTGCDISVDNKDIKDCEKEFGSTVDTSRIFFTKRLEKIDPKQLTKDQYRHLRTSVEMLRDNGVIHGDLPDNIMLGPTTGMPVIIDWDSSSLINKSNENCKDLDIFSFNSHFKIHKKSI